MLPSNNPRGSCPSACAVQARIQQRSSRSARPHAAAASVGSTMLLAKARGRGHDSSAIAARYAPAAAAVSKRRRRGGAPEAVAVRAPGSGSAGTGARRLIDDPGDDAGRGVPREACGPVASGSRQVSTERVVVADPPDRLAQGVHIARQYEESRFAVAYRIAQARDGGRGGGRDTCGGPAPGD